MDEAIENRVGESGRVRRRRARATRSKHNCKREGQTAGRHSIDAVEFIGRLVSHIPDTGRVMQRYYGYYAIRTRGGAGRRNRWRPRPGSMATSQPATRSYSGAE